MWVRLVMLSRGDVVGDVAPGVVGGDTLGFIEFRFTGTAPVLVVTQCPEKRTATVHSPHKTRR